MPFEHLLRDPVLIILALASLVSWALIIDSLLVLRRVCREDRLCLEGKQVPNAPIASLRQELHTNEGADRPHLLTVMDAAIVLQRQRLEKSLPLLGVIGSTAPYVGLLGTVIGIIQAFQAIEARNNMSPSIVAGGIATALVATAMGLAVAIPAVAAHHLISAAITRRVSMWESVVAQWLPQDSREAKRESIPVA